MKPKPHSIQRRFILLQASSFALAIWFLAAAVYLNQRIQRDLEQPVNDLHSALRLNTQMEAAQAQFLAAAARAYFQSDKEAWQQYQALAQTLPDLVERYLNLPLAERQRQLLGTVRALQRRLAERASRPPVTRLNTRESLRQFSEVRDVNEQIESLLHSASQAHLQDLDRTAARLRRFTLALYLLLAAFALFATAALVYFRRSHQREIWGPLEELRRMVGEIRRGNLDLSGQVPDSIEFGPLLNGFLAMAGELRDIRNSLEDKVRERTAKLEAAQSELVQAAKLSSLGQLVSGVAHEINNPLTSILGFAELGLARPDLDPRLQQQLQTIREESLRLKNLVDSLSSFARRAPQRTARVDLRGVLNRLADLRRYQLSANNIALHCQPPSEPVWVEADPDQLVQVFFNLVLNSEQAIAARRARGDIWIACGAEGGHAWATVRDNGPGIPLEFQQRIFDPFFTTKPVGLGSGLGLSISHGIIEQHHGSISVQSTERQGTTIRIVLPAAPAAPEVAAGPAQTGAPDRGREALQMRALIIDDEPAIIQLLGQYLGSAGWQCTVMEESTAVEAVLETRDFELVICDLKMPGKNGLEILGLIREKKPKLARRFLLMTGNLGGAEHQDPADQAGAPVLRKPFTLAQLAEAIRALVPHLDPPSPA